jgi:rSAM/selenodomain-associated transferase 2
VISVIIPTLNAEAHLPRALAALLPATLEGLLKEVIVSDGGSSDLTRAVAEAAGCAIVDGPKGRGAQLRLGAQEARAPWLLFLHADTALEPAWVDAARAFMQAPGAEARAAAFRFAFDDASLSARWVAFWVAVRCAALKLPYGDQGLLISRKLYDALGGFADLPLMEDVDMIRRIGARRLSILPARAITSADKYRRDGYLRRAARNLVLLARYLMGASPAELAKRYD